MRISELLSLEFEEEVKKTRAMLERVPNDKTTFTPHPKSMPLGQLAPHIAQLTEFGLIVLTEPGLDFEQRNLARLALESGAQLARVFDDGAAKIRVALSQLEDRAWSDRWTLSFQEKTLFAGTRFVAYRQTSMNHIVHHRAQLGVY
jgi:hypothetical protein